MLSEKWRIKLFNGLEVTGSGKTVDRFRSRTSAELLALLVLRSHRSATREEIAGTIWPDNSPESGRAGLRTALASLRALLEPPGTSTNTVLRADRTNVRLLPEAFTADVLDFTTESARSASARSASDQLTSRLQAVQLYSGELLPGYYSEWILAEREKQHQIYLRHLKEIVALYRSANQPSLAIEYASRLLDDNRSDEDAWLLLMQLNLEVEQYEDALACFDQLESMLSAEFQAAPGDEAAELAITARRRLSAFKESGSSRVQAVATAQTANILSDASGEDLHNPQLQSAPQSTGLPISLTRFFGRETEIMNIVRMICPDSVAGMPRAAPQRLITVTGTGGTGKSRLAAEVGATICGQYGMQVTFVPFAHLSDPGQVLEAIAVALKVAAADAEGLFEQIASAVHGSQYLLILDNLEQLLSLPEDNDSDTLPKDCQLLPGVVDCVSLLLERAPELRCLITSRQSLGIEGEQEYPLQPLATPALPATPDRLLDFASVKLFVDRAQLSRPEFQLTARNADQVGAICARLDGLPLALELAAAWSSSLSPAQILERLAQRFELLVGRRRGRTARHASLRAALDWSYQLLNSEQQMFFSRLSAFYGGWTVQAAAFVCSSSDALETLAALQDRSLISMDESADNTADELRCRLLESLREYAAEQLDDHDARIALRRHLSWYSTWSSAAYLNWGGTEQQVWLERVEIEHENIRAALEFSVVDEDPASPPAGMLLLVNLGHFWSLRGNYTSARDLCRRFLDHTGTQDNDVLRARALIIEGGLACFQKDWKAAEILYLQGLTIAKRCVPTLVGSVQIKLGDVALVGGEVALAEKYYQDALTSYQAMNMPHGVAAVQGALGVIALQRCNYEEAVTYSLLAVEVNRQQSNLSGVTHHLCQLGLCYAKAGQLREACLSFSESLAGYGALKDNRGMAELFTAIADGFPISAESVSLLAAAQTIYHAVAAAPMIDQPMMDGCHTALGEVGFNAAWSEGLQYTTDQAAQKAATLLALLVGEHAPTAA